MRETPGIYCHFYHEVREAQRAEFIPTGGNWDGSEFCRGRRSKDTGRWQQADTLALYKFKIPAWFVSLESVFPSSREAVNERDSSLR